MSTQDRMEKKFEPRSSILVIVLLIFGIVTPSLVTSCKSKDWFNRQDLLLRELVEIKRNSSLFKNNDYNEFRYYYWEPDGYFKWIYFDQSIYCELVTNGKKRWSKTIPAISNKERLFDFLCSDNMASHLPWSYPGVIKMAIDGSNRNFIFGTALIDLYRALETEFSNEIVQAFVDDIRQVLEALYIDVQEGLFHIWGPPTPPKE